MGVETKIKIDGVAYYNTYNVFINKLSKRVPIHFRIIKTKK